MPRANLRHAIPSLAAVGHVSRRKRLSRGSGGPRQWLVWQSYLDLRGCSPISSHTVGRDVASMLAQQSQPCWGAVFITAIAACRFALIPPGTPVPQSPQQMIPSADPQSVPALLSSGAWMAVDYECTKREEQIPRTPSLLLAGRDRSLNCSVRIATCKICSHCLSS